MDCITQSENGRFSLLNFEARFLEIERRENEKEKNVGCERKIRESRKVGTESPQTQMERKQKERGERVKVKCRNKYHHYFFFPNNTIVIL